MPNFSNDFAMFRGVVFLNSENTIKLPLTTTKKGIDTSSDVYKKLIGYMVRAMNPIVSFLKDVRRLEAPREYRSMLKDQNDTNLNIIQLREMTIEADRVITFAPPSLNYEEIQKKPNFIRIAFTKERIEAEKVKEHSGRKTFKDLGEFLFDYYVSMEEINNG